MRTNYKTGFIELALNVGALTFGQFTLKSGRVSPYFFNSGLFNHGDSAAKRGRFYASATAASGISFDMLFGPAYKGIPLVALTAAALAEHEGLNTPFSFNRKEVKDHGEQGIIVGAPIRGRVLIVDDVITAGTATRDSVDMIRRAGGVPAGVLISLDRQERGTGDLSAVQETERDVGVPIVSIIGLDDLMRHLETHPQLRTHMPAVAEYQAKYGVAR